MAKVSREKIVLMVFLLLIAATIVLLIGYFSMARTWNAVASYVDDTMGATEKYTVIAYSGVLPASKASSDVIADLADSASDDDYMPADDVGTSDALTRPGTTADDLTDALTQSQDGSSDDSSNVSDESQNPFLSTTQPGKKTVFVSDVRDNYERQGSDVLTLNLADVSTYLQPTVLSMRDHKIGVFGINFYATLPYLESMRTQLQEQGADIIICLTPRTAMLADESYADIVIVTTDEEDVNTVGSYIDNTFTVKSPEAGTVGVITISSDNAVFAKVVDSL